MKIQKINLSRMSKKRKAQLMNIDVRHENYMKKLDKALQGTKKLYKEIDCEKVIVTDINTVLESLDLLINGIVSNCLKIKSRNGSMIALRLYHSHLRDYDIQDIKQELFIEIYNNFKSGDLLLTYEKVRTYTELVETITKVNGYKQKGYIETFKHIPVLNIEFTKLETVTKTRKYKDFKGDCQVITYTGETSQAKRDVMNCVSRYITKHLERHETKKQYIDLQIENELGTQETIYKLIDKVSIEDMKELDILATLREKYINNLDTKHKTIFEMLLDGKKKVDIEKKLVGLKMDGKEVTQKSIRIAIDNIRKLVSVELHEYLKDIKSLIDIEERKDFENTYISTYDENITFTEKWLRNMDKKTQEIKKQ